MSYLYLDFEPPELTNKLLCFLPLQEFKCDALTYEHAFFRTRDRFKNDARSYLESYAILFGEDGKAAPLGELSSLGRNRVLEKKGGTGFVVLEGAAQARWGVARHLEASQAGEIAAKITAFLSGDGESGTWGGSLECGNVVVADIRGAGQEFVPGDMPVGSDPGLRVLRHREEKRRLRVHTT
jgi:hypothetical protein